MDIGVVQEAEMAARSSRRKFLRRLASGLPALAAGAPLAHTGTLLATGKKKASEFPGDPAAWRSKFLDQARSERGGVAVTDAIEAPVRPSDMPLVMDISRGPIAVASPANDITAKPADPVRMH